MFKFEYILNHERFLQKNVFADTLIFIIMKSVILIFSFCFGSIISIFSQTTVNYPEYFILIGIANEQKAHNNYDSAFVNYKKAFKLVDYVFKKDLEVAIELAKKTNCDSLHNIFKNQLKGIEDGIDTDYMLKIKKLFELDQKFRNKKYRNALYYYTDCIADSLCNKNGKKFIKAKLRCEEWRRIDSTNIHQLIKLMGEKGFPGERLVGAKGAEQAFFIMLHFDYDGNNKILEPYLNKAILSGNISPKNYAQIVDRRRINLKEDPMYYVIPFGYEKLTEEQKKEVDKKRASIGLLPVSKSQTIIRKKNSIRVIYNE